MNATHFHIGQNDPQNDPGYLPDSEAYWAEDAEHAFRCLCEDLRSYAQDDDEGWDAVPDGRSDGTGYSGALAGAIIRDDGPEILRFLRAGKPVSINLQRNDGWIRVFSAEPCSDPDCAE